MRTAIVLFTRNLRVHDNPALAAAVAAAQRVVPLFVFDRAVLARFGAPNRVAYLLDALADLDDSLSGRGGALFVREGEVVEEVMRIARETGAEAVYAGEDARGEKLGVAEVTAVGATVDSAARSVMVRARMTGADPAAEDADE